jgi:hypothetical protein
MHWARSIRLGRAPDVSDSLVDRPPELFHDRALRTFALTYADQTEQDHMALVKAVRDGRVEALTEE